MIRLAIFQSKPKARVRTKGKGTARRQLEERQARGVTALGALPYMTRRQYKAAKRVWPG